MTRVIHMMGEDKDLVYIKELSGGQAEAEMWICLNSESEGEKLYAPGPPPPENLVGYSFDEIAVMFNILGYRVLPKGVMP